MLAADPPIVANTVTPTCTPSTLAATDPTPAQADPAYADTTTPSPPPSPPGSPQTGYALRIASIKQLLGLSLQLATFIAFMAMLWLFICRVRALAQRDGSGTGMGKWKWKWKCGQRLGSRRSNPCCWGSGWRARAYASRSGACTAWWSSRLGLMDTRFGMSGCCMCSMRCPMWAAIAAMGWWHPVRPVKGGDFAGVEEGGEEGGGGMLTVGLGDGQVRYGYCYGRVLMLGG
ncbi:hypothetical protein GJ744_003878 [Endocarpon pusillum]|uniref:Copper transporter n=1 Tax=Endocarpon pusillum TaxID=364733 RepID=A0A8H7AV62_9EURO|nr:hypothetical protein GJ744_003878 [Endocarpon pusillum]